ncbi:L,D-transpeptidase family protein [Legionella massiliensis]|nr:L,D-transpeptidase family protein [Legionella massiliensis]
MKIKFSLAAILLTLSCTAFTAPQIIKSASTTNCDLLLNQSKNIPDSTSQIIVVRSLGDVQAEMTACQRKKQIWKPVFKSDFKVVIGKNGVILPDAKQEGDLKTPAGLYPLGEAFGSEPLALKMDYRYLTPDDKYVDDIEAKDYNQWVIGETKATSYETMLIAPYKMGIVVNYNKNPTIPGAGSAIFIHLWRNPKTGTHGCIATDERHLLEILHWLDKNQHPYIFIR